ncbi:MAG: hypothetical protein AAFR59_17765, partial [Bacteroidota bacterium]
MSDTSYTSLPLQPLLAFWAVEVRTVDPATQIQIQEVLHTYGPSLIQSGKPAQLRMLIGPMLVQTPEEQEIFKRIFEEQYLPLVTDHVEETEENEIPPEVSAEARASAQIKKLRPAVYTLMIIGAILLNVGLFKNNMPEVARSERPEVEDSFDLGTKPYEELKNGIETQGDIPSSSVTRPSITDPSLWESMAQEPQLTFSVHPERTYAGIDTRKPLVMSAVITPQLPGINHYIHWSTGDVQKAGKKFIHQFKTPGLHEVELGILEWSLSEAVEEREASEIGDDWSKKAKGLLFIPKINHDKQEYDDFHTEVNEGLQDAMKIRVLLLILLMIFLAEGG